MSGGEGHESFPADELGELVERLRPRVRELMVHYCISEDRAGLIVYEAMLGLAHRWHTVPDRERWFLDAVEHACAGEGTDTASDSH